MATVSERAAAIRDDPEARIVWTIVVAAVLTLVIIGWGFRPR